jgi:ketosteroid isomerase-like protein
MKTMLTVSILLASWALVPGQASETSQAGAAGLEQELRRLEHEWMDGVVRRDRAALDRFLADDFLLLGETWAGDRELTDKTRWIDNSVTLIEARSFAFDKMRIQAREDVAVVHCLFTFEATVKGQPWKSTARVTDTWIREAGRWRVLARHASALTPSP